MTWLWASILAFAAAGAQPPEVAGISTRPPDPGQVQLLANCFDACTLNVVLSGNGSGNWKSTNSGGVPNGLIDCTWLMGAQAPGSDCSQVYCCVDRASAVTVYFAITAGTGSDACYLATCVETGPIYGNTQLPSVNNPVTKTIGATFNRLLYSVTVSKNGGGTGTVTSSVNGINCGPFCDALVAYGSMVTFSAAPTPGSVFAGWSGACAGQPATCSISIGGITDIGATFNVFVPTPTPGVPTPTPTATPRVTARPTSAPVATPKATAVTSTNGPAATTAGSPATTDAAGPSAPAQPTDTPPAIAASPSATEPATVPAVAGSDLTPIALAILGAGLLVAIGIGFAAFALRKRPAPPPSGPTGP